MIFARYTEKARRVIFFARYESVVHKSLFIEPVHILLGIIREDGSLMLKLLPNMTPDDLRKKIEESLSEKIINIMVSGEKDISPVSKRVLKNAVSLSNPENITPGDLLRSLLEIKESIPRDIREMLSEHGITASAVEQAMISITQNVRLIVNTSPLGEV